VITASGRVLLAVIHINAGGFGAIRGPRLGLRAERSL